MTDGKWTTARVKHAIRWASQSQVRTGKNSADIELTITAMDLLHERGVAGFCIVSSNSDFTPLVMRLRESGKLVIGFGEKKSPAAFVEVDESTVHTSEGVAEYDKVVSTPLGAVTVGAASP